MQFSILEIPAAYVTFQILLILEVCVKLIGEECFCTDKTKSARTDSSSSLKRHFLETENTVLQSEYLDDGEYEFRFKLDLPNRIPSSFVGKYGYVRYYIRACMYREGQERLEDMKVFQVFSPIDLNEMENVSITPIIYLDEPVMETLWLCTYQKHQMKVRLERNVFVVGGIVSVAVEIWKKLTISAVKVQLLMEIRAKVSPQRKEYLDVAELVAFDEACLAGYRRKKSYMFTLKLPDTFTIPNFEECFFFSQRAVLQVIAVSGDSSKPDLKMQIDVILGHVPAEQEKLAINSRGKERAVVACVIRPVPYRTIAKLPTNTPNSETNNLPTSMPKPCLPCPTKIPPLPCDSNLSNPTMNSCPYPPEPPLTDFLSINSSSSSKDAINITYPPVPYSSLSNPFNKMPFPSPYPTESQITHPLRLLPKENAKDLAYPPQANTAFNPNRNICPYPVIENLNRAPYPTIGTPPYPRMEPRRYRLSSSISERESPCRSITRSLNSTPINCVNALPSTVVSIAPYPTGIPAVMPMPMPLVNSPPVQHSIGFDLLISEQNFSQIQYPPSAPTVSELPTDTIEELEDTSVEAVGSSLRNIPQESDSTDVSLSSAPPPSYEEMLSSIRKEKKAQKRKVLVAS